MLDTAPELPEAGSVSKPANPLPDMSRWAFAAFRDVLAALPPDMGEADVVRDELRLFDDGRVALYYAPFDYVNEHARVILMGITPGRFQYWKACVVARDGIAAGLPEVEILRRVKESASFSGPMRKHLVTMLDGIGLAGALGLATSASLFDADAKHLFSTSAVSFPVFVRGENYTGSTPRLLGHPVLRSVAETFFAERVNRVPGALIVPLGKVASEVAEHLASRNMLDRRRLLVGFPHPSGGNGYRVRDYNKNRDALARGVREWFG